MLTPFIRQDLKLSKGPKKEDGSSTWLLYDALRNKYFSINKKAFDLLSNWTGGQKMDEFIVKMQSINASIHDDEIKDFANFLNINNLTTKKTQDEVKSLVVQKNKLNKHWLLKLVHNYLFFKIPFFRPGSWLETTLPYVSVLGSRLVRNIIYILGLIGLYLTISNYETFLNTFSYFFNLNGLIFYILTIIVIKALHELGHAYVATYYKCNVSSIGLAMLVFFPFLYTDTSDAWKLTDHRKRLLINFAGMLTELHIALIATFAWAIMPEGILKSAAFFVATSSWISSLLINISPFMRFDGYYVLSDYLKADNLQPRSFELGRWQLREWIFGFKFQPPEQLMSNRRWTFIIYAWSTWLYRFFIFIGIALLVYYLTFKVLGIILFIIEIVWFILLPIYREVKRWWGLRKSMTVNRTSMRSLSLFCVLLVALFIPWRTSLSLPAVIEKEAVIDIFPPEDSMIKNIFIDNNQFVKKGDVLIRFTNPYLATQVEQAIDRVKLIQKKLDRRIGSEIDMSNLMVLENQLKKELEVLNNLKEQSKELTIYANQDSTVVDLKDLENNQWVSQNDKLFSLIESGNSQVIAYVNETDLNKIKSKSTGVFFSKNNEYSNIEVQLTDLNETSTEELPYLSLTSSYGGPIATREVEGKKSSQRPEKALYQVNFQTLSQHSDLQWETPGVVKLKSENYNVFQNLFNLVTSTLIQESGF